MTTSCKVSPRSVACCSNVGGRLSAKRLEHLLDDVAGCVAPANRVCCRKEIAIEPIACAPVLEEREVVVQPARRGDELVARDPLLGDGIGDLLEPPALRQQSRSSLKPGHAECDKRRPAPACCG